MSGSLLLRLSSEMNEIHIHSSFLENNSLVNIQKKLNSKCECYLTLKLIKDLAEECIKESTDLNKNLKLAIKNQLLHATCVHIAPFPIKPPTKLTYLEGRQLIQDLKHRLTKRLTELDPPLCTDFRGNAQSIQTDTILIERKQNFFKTQTEHLEKVRQLEQVLCKIVKTRLGTIPQVAEKQIRHAELTNELNQVKMQLTERKMRVDIFTETNKSLEAYKKLIAHIQTQRTEHEKEIETLENLKDRFRRVNSAEFNKILTSYLQYKKSIEKKRMIYECIL